MDRRLLTMKYPYCWFCGGQWTWISKSKAIVWHAPKPVNRFCERPKSITFAHGCLCDPGFWSPLIFAYTVLYFYLHMYILYTSIFVYWTDYTVYIYINIYIYMYTFYIYIYTYILYTNILNRFVDVMIISDIYIWSPTELWKKTFNLDRRRLRPIFP
jgi:hypothetical protein